MSKIALSPDANGAGIFTIASPNSGTNRTLTLPDETGTLVSTGGGQTVTAPAFIPTGASVPANGMYLPTTNTVAWSTASTERMRVDSSGNLLVGTNTSIGNGGIIQAKVPSGAAAYFQTTAASGIQNVIDVTNISNAGMIALRFFVNGYGATQVGSISCTTSATTYGSGSDYRLKENITPMVGALDKVKLLKPVTYTWKSDGSFGQGFIAHELQEIVPECVVGEKDAVNEKGNPQYQMVDPSKLVATLAAAIQELNAKVEAQAAEIAALKGAK